MVSCSVKSQRQPLPRLLTARWGLLRSILIYYGIPWRYGQLKRFYSQFVGPGDLCFDVGAHVGNRLRAWAALGAQVVGLEPQPDCMALLRRWYGRNPQIILLEQAVGAQRGSLPLMISRGHPTVSTLSQQWTEDVRQAQSFAAVRWDDAIEVPVTTLDALIEQYGCPAFCKIDVEGYELEVLRGLSQPLPALSIEYVPVTMGVALNCIQRLEQLGGYEYNWSPGERHRLQSPQWLGPAALADQLSAVPPDGDSGDFYARLRRYSND